MFVSIIFSVLKGAAEGFDEIAGLEIGFEIGVEIGLGIGLEIGVVGFAFGAELG